MFGLGGNPCEIDDRVLYLYNQSRIIIHKYAYKRRNCCVQASLEPRRSTSSAYIEIGGARVNNKLKVAIVGSTGYGGVELIRFFQNHPLVEITSVISSSSSGESIADGFPHLTDVIRRPLDGVDPAEIASRADLVFTATPSGVSAKLVPSLLAAGLKVIDLSGDFRLKDGTVYEEWYKHPAPPADLLEQAVYGMAEVYGEEVKGQNFISNPGCYPTATLLGLIPAVEAGWIDPSTIIIDAKSGVSRSRTRNKSDKPLCRDE